MGSARHRLSYKKFQRPQPRVLYNTSPRILSAHANLRVAEWEQTPQWHQHLRNAEHDCRCPNISIQEPISCLAKEKLSQVSTDFDEKHARFDINEQKGVAYFVHRCRAHNCHCPSDLWPGYFRELQGFLDLVEPAKKEIKHRSQANPSSDDKN